MRYDIADPFDFETLDDAADPQAPPQPADEPAVDTLEAGGDADEPAAADGPEEPAPPLWSTADDHVLHLPPQSVDRVLVGVPQLWPRRPAPWRPGVPPRRQAINALGGLIRQARRIGTRPGRVRGAAWPVFRSRAGGRNFRIVARPRAGLRHEILSIEPELGEMERELPAPAAGADQAVAALAAEWSRRRNGTPSVDAMTAWLTQDRNDTLAGARRRWSKGQHTADAVARAWLVSRREQMRFKTEWPSGLKRLANFAPPPQPVALVSTPLIADSTEAKVAPLLVRFVEDLRRRYPKFNVWNYPGHGGGAFLNRGFSLDLAIPGRDPRGFYPPEEAITFLRAIHETAKRLGAEWRVLYNDFTVANTLNRETGVAHVFFMGTARRNAKKGVTGLNWHGPHPLILHFHLDLAPASRRA